MERRPELSQPEYQPIRSIMHVAIQEAVNARIGGDYSIGAAIERNGKLLVSAENRVKRDEDPTSHAEIVAIRKATKLLGRRHIEDCVLYTTHEPCPMCTATAVWGRLRGIVSGAMIEDMSNYRLTGGNDTWSWRTIDIPAAYILEKGTPRLFIVEGFMREDCRKLFHSK